MDAVRMVLVLLLAVVVSRILGRLSPIRLPLPILQIGIGAVVSYVIGFDVAFDPDVFFLLLIAPLLFLDGWRIPKGAFVSDWGPILTLAIGLVVFTVVGLGPLIDTMIPAIPLSVAFAVAAMLSPTDAVSVSAISAGTPIPARLMRILEGEALLNDASGLVCFRFAVAAALTGSFSLADASLSFLKLLAQEGELYVLAQSRDRVAKDRAMRQRQLKRLWARLKQLSTMQLTREELLMKLGAARDQSRIAWRLAVIEVAADCAAFSYR